MKSELVTIKELKIFLDNLSSKVKVRVYYNDEGRGMKSTKKIKTRYTLNQIGDALFAFINSTNKRFDIIDSRLDYIVKENNLKDTPKTKH